MFKGERVVLRASQREDMRRQWEFENNVELWYWDGNTPRPTSLEQLLAHFDQNMTKWDDNKAAFAIEADGKYIGHCSLHEFDATCRHCELSIEIGDPAYWGHGYGREVIGLLLDYAFHHLNFNRVWLNTHSNNERAIRCYRAAGFVEEGRLRQHLWLRGQFVDRVMMAVLREDYLGRPAT